MRLFRLEHREERVEGAGDAAAEGGTIGPFLLNLSNIGMQVRGVLLVLGPLLLSQLATLGVGDKSLADAVGTLG